MEVDMKYVTLAALAAGMTFAGSAGAAVYVVDAFANSSSGGTGVNSLTLNAGDLFTVFVDSDDLWNAGALPRYSDADGLDGDRLATASDDSGQPVGTLIGTDFGFWVQHGLSARYGSLVGELGGVYQVLGTNFSGPAWNTGTLRLYYWDSNFGDNTGNISANITAAIPEPASWALMIGGFGMAGAMLRRHRSLAAG
jgi:hypothetical protein